MKCTRCGVEDVMVTGDGGTHCGGCSTARDWQALIALVHDAQVITPIASDTRILRSA